MACHLMLLCIRYVLTYFFVTSPQKLKLLHFFPAQSHASLRDTPGHGFHPKKFKCHVHSSDRVYCRMHLIFLKGRRAIMSATNSPRRVTPSAKGYASLTCPQCDQHIRVNVSALYDAHCPVTVDCNCGHQFPILVDTTKLLRKPTRLMGTYAKFQKLGSDESGFIDIEELSIGGITFRTRTPHMIRSGDLLRIRFAVDNATHAEISKSIVVRHVEDYLIGGEFCEKTAHDPALALYLKPS